MRNYNIESQKMQKKKELVSNYFYYCQPVKKTKSARGVNGSRKTRKRHEFR
jgi:hypothetical protein